MVTRMQVAIIVFDGMAALDAVGPYEVMRMMPGVTVTSVSAEPGLKRAAGGLGVVADAALDDVLAPDVVLMPGGPGEAEVRRDARVLDWLRTTHRTTRWTTSVCTGALTLAAAGLLDGLRATTHWLAMDDLAAMGALAVSERVVVEEQARVITAAGVSAGIDMGLVMAGLVAGDEVAELVQLILEYDPQPPYSSGSPSKAPAGVVERARTARRQG